jgi:glycosyltransferase involved in cell wall biosynthesis
MTLPDIVFALTGDVRKNSRALKQLRALGALGCRIDVLSLGHPHTQRWAEPGTSLHVVPVGAGSGPRFFSRIHRAFYAAAVQRPVRIYHASDLFVLPAMAAAARKHGGLLAYDARELYTHVAATTGRPWVRWFWGSIERRYIYRAQVVFTVSDSIADHLASLYDIQRPILVYNVPPRQAIAPSRALRTRLNLPDAPVLLLHQGQMQRDRGCERLVAAMRAVERAVLIFLGGGPLKNTLQQQAAALHLHDRVRFLDPVPPDALLPVTASADLGVTLLEDTCLNHRYALPNKLFEYLTAGLPVLASDLPELHRVVAGYDVGCVVDPNDAQALASTLQRMVDDGEARARWAANAPNVLQTFSWEKSSERFKAAYQTLFSAHS